MPGSDRFAEVAASRATTAAVKCSLAAGVIADRLRDLHLHVGSEHLIDLRFVLNRRRLIATAVIREHTDRSGELFVGSGSGG